MKYLTTVNDKTYTIEINDDRHVVVDGKSYDIDIMAFAVRDLYSLILDNVSHEAFVDSDGDDWQVLLKGDLYSAKVVDERAVRLAKSAGGTVQATGDFNLKAPMPGLVVSVPVTEGQTVQKGDILLILESMKMQNELKSPRDGTVLRVKVKSGETVEQNQIMVTIGSS